MPVSRGPGTETLCEDIVDTVLQRNMIALFSVVGAELEGSSLALQIFSTLQGGGCPC